VKIAFKSDSFFFFFFQIGLEELALIQSIKMMCLFYKIKKKKKKKEKKKSM
jgi:hypothetical protein